MQITQFVQACNKADVNSDEIAELAGVDLMQATVADLEKLRKTFKQFGASKAGE
ncbi:MAG: hypothetical protein ACO28P_06815 [Ilumatobacteraceae bacterium]